MTTKQTQRDIDIFIYDMDNCNRESLILYNNKQAIINKEGKEFYDNLQKEICDKMNKIILDFKNKR